MYGVALDVALALMKATKEIMVLREENAKLKEVIAINRFVLAAVFVLVATSSVWAQSNQLSWIDNSNNESNFRVERTTAIDVPSCQTATGFVQIGTTPANIVGFNDAVVIQGTTYCYRVRASNSGGDSGYSNIAGRTVPFSPPAAPSGLGVTAGP